MANRTLTDTATVSWDEATANQVKGNVVDDSITNAKLANMAQATIKGRADAAGTGDPTDLSVAQVAAILAAVFQPLDSDLTAIAALSTTAYGRSLLALANATALAAEVDSFFLTPTEGNAAYQPLDSDLTAIAALSTTAFGRAFLALADAAAARTAIGAVNIAGDTLTGGLVLAAGTTSLQPLKFVSGTNLTTPTAGVMEYDGKAFYATAVASSRQVVSAEQISVLASDNTGSDANTAQAVFSAAQDTLTLAGSTTYEFEADYHIFRAAGTTSHTFGVLFGGTATFTHISYLAQVINPTGNVLANVQMIKSLAATLVTLTAANTSATENINVKLRGIMRINAGGTLIPQYQYSAAPGGAPTVETGSFFRCWPIGDNTVTAVGNWG